MWTRSLLKENAKLALSGRYWRCFLVSFVISLLGGSVVSITQRFNETHDIATGRYTGTFDEVHYQINSLPAGLLAAVGVILLVSAVLALCWNIFLLNPLEIGCCRYYMESRQARAPYNTVTGVFRAPYGNVVKVRFLVGLKVTLGCLIIVPGIYWAYCYAMVPYLLAENPYLTTERAMELSRDMMDGEKWHYFVLMLSFIGWHLLAALTMGIGEYFLAPYIAATSAEFYAAMRAKALSTGMSTPQELGGFMRHEGV